MLLALVMCACFRLEFVRSFRNLVKQENIGVSVVAAH